MQINFRMLNNLIFEIDFRLYINSTMYYRNGNIKAYSYYHMNFYFSKLQKSLKLLIIKH